MEDAYFPTDPHEPEPSSDAETQHRLATRLERLRDAAFAAGTAPFETLKGMVFYAAREIALSADAETLEHVLQEASRRANAAANFES